MFSCEGIGGILKCLPIKKCLAVRDDGPSGDNESKGSIGRELRIDLVVHKHVSSSSYVNWCSFITFFRTNFIDLTAHSQIPPYCGFLAGEKFHLRSYLLTNISIPSEDLSSLYICCTSMRSVLDS